MLSLIASGFSADGLLNATIAFTIGAAGVLVAVIAFIYQVKERRSTRADAAAVWEKQAGELSDRLDRQRETEIARLTNGYEAQIRQFAKRIEASDRDVHRWQRIALERGKANDGSRAHRESEPDRGVEETPGAGGDEDPEAEDADDYP